MNCGGRGLENDWRYIPVQLTRRRGEVAPGDMQRGPSETSGRSYCASLAECPLLTDVHALAGGTQTELRLFLPFGKRFDDY